MLRYHMSVITRDPGLKRSIKRLTTATGATADFVRDSSQVNPTRPINLAIFDARSDLPDRRFFSQIPRSARVLYIVSGDDLVSRVPLFEDQRVTSLFCHDERFDDDEFICSATKALRGEIFGLQKYFPWGVTTFTMLVKNYDEKGRAIEIMQRYAQMAGVRGPVRDRIQLVADELMMNALYHAPVNDRGQSPFDGMTLKQLAQLPEVNPIQVQYGCSGQYFGVAVRDAGGSLRRDRALEYLARARGGGQMEQKDRGAGLGLISVLHSVSKLVFNLAPGYSTEVISLFDMELFAHGKVGARSLHLFTATATAAAELEDEEESLVTQGKGRPRGKSHTGAWLLAALLTAVLASLGTIYLLKSHPEWLPGGRGASEAASTAEPPPGDAVARTLMVVTEPTTAQVRINGTPVTAGVALSVPADATELRISVKAHGYRTWSRTLEASDLAGAVRFYVRLDRER